METLSFLFVLAFFGFGALLLWGLVAPRSAPFVETRGQALVRFGLLGFVCFICAGVFAPDEWDEEGSMETETEVEADIAAAIDAALTGESEAGKETAVARPPEARPPATADPTPRPVAAPNVVVPAPAPGSVRPANTAALSKKEREIFAYYQKIKAITPDLSEADTRARVARRYETTNAAVDAIIEKATE